MYRRVFDDCWRSLLCFSAEVRVLAKTHLLWKIYHYPLYILIISMGRLNGIDVIDHIILLFLISFYLSLGMILIFVKIFMFVRLIKSVQFQISIVMDLQLSLFYCRKAFKNILDGRPDQWMKRDVRRDHTSKVHKYILVH